MPDASALNKLLDARYEWEHSEIEFKPEREKFYRILLDAAYREAAAVRPSLSRHTFLDAIDVHYRKCRHTRRKTEMGSIPPEQRGN